MNRPVEGSVNAQTTVTMAWQGLRPLMSCISGTQAALHIVPSVEVKGSRV